MLRTVLEKIFSFINSFRLNDDKKIIETLIDGLRDVLDENDPNFDIEVYFQDELDEETISAVEESEPGATKDGHEVVAFTYMNDDGNFDMVFALEAVKRFVAKENPLHLKSEIRGIAKHEAYHVLQFLYVFEHGGVTSLDKLFADVEQRDYWDNVLEKGAYLFQWLDIQQDFSRDFAPYVCKACA